MLAWAGQQCKSICGLSPLLLCAIKVSPGYLPPRHSPHIFLPPGGVPRASLLSAKVWSMRVWKHRAEARPEDRGQRHRGLPRTLAGSRRVKVAERNWGGSAKMTKPRDVQMPVEPTTLHCSPAYNLLPSPPVLLSRASKVLSQTVEKCIGRCGKFELMWVSQNSAPLQVLKC